VNIGAFFFFVFLPFLPSNGAELTRPYLLFILDRIYTEGAHCTSFFPFDIEIFLSRLTPTFLFLLPPSPVSSHFDSPMAREHVSAEPLPWPCTRTKLACHFQCVSRRFPVSSSSFVNLFLSSHPARDPSSPSSSPLADCTDPSIADACPDDRYDKEICQCFDWK
jgi:hypothetical protein